MTERAEPRAPLSLRPPALPAIPAGRAAATPSAGSVMELPLGEIAGDLHAIPRRDRRTACYELMVSNDTPRPVATFAYAAATSKRSDRVTWNAILVPPYSAIAVEIDVALPRSGRFPRLVAELHAEDAKLTLEGGPPHRHGRGTLRRGALAAAALVLLGFGTSSIAKNQPHVVAVAAPPSVRGGVPFSVAYAVGQATGADYAVETAGGLQVARGTLPAGSGAFMVALPQNSVSGGYDIRVTAHGRFGSDERTTHVVALATPRGPAPKDLRVTDIALEAETVHGGEPIGVRYSTKARSGYVRLIDEIGTVRAEALLNPHGRSVLQAPFVEADQDLRLVIDAQQGAARAEGEVPVRILRAAAPPPGLAGATGTLVPGLAGPNGQPATTGDMTVAEPQPQSDASADAPPAGAPLPGGAAPPADPQHGVISVATRQQLGLPITVGVEHTEPGLRVAVMGPSGDEIEAVDVPPGAAQVVLPAISGRPQRLSVVATYAKGFGQETFIRPIVLRR